MRHLTAAGTLAGLLIVSHAAWSQENTGQGWVWVPGVSFVRMFPGNTISGDSELRTFVGPYLGESYRYESYGGQVRVQGFSAALEPVVLTFGAGIHWFSRSGSSAVSGILPTADKGIGEQLGPGSFTVFPLGAGLQFVVPSRPTRGLSGFVGAEGNLVFVDGDVDMNQQAKGGYTLMAGFSVGAFECGVRYATFSDIRNLGIQLGLKFQTLPQ